MLLAAELLMAARRYDGHSGNIEQPVTRMVGHDEIAHGAYWVPDKVRAWHRYLAQVLRLVLARSDSWQVRQ